MAVRIRSAASLLCLLLLLFLAGLPGAFIWPAAAQARTQASSAEEIGYAELFDAVWSIIAENFVGSAEDVDWFAARNEFYPKVSAATSDEEAYRHLAEMVALLGDPFTFLLTPEQVRDVPAAQDSSSFSGVGMMLVQYPDGSIVVTDVFDRGPASRAGVRKGVRIVAVDGETTAGKGINEVVEGIRGPQGTHVALTIADPAGVERTISVRRAQIHVETEVTSSRLAGGIGYLSIPSFGQGMEVQVLNHLRKLYRSQGLIIDLRNHDRTVNATSFLRIAGLFTADPLGGLYTRQGLFLLQPDRTWEGGTGALGVPPPTRLDFWEKPVAIVVDGSVALSQFAVAFVTALVESGRAVLVGRGVPPSPGVGTGSGVVELPGGALLAVANSQLFSVNEQRIIDSIDVHTEVPLNQEYLEAWYRGDDLDIEAARLGVMELLSR